MEFIKKLVLIAVIKVIAVSGLFAQSNTLLNGTIIITLTSKDTIWVGADSRTSALTEKGYTVNKSGMCKIYSTDDIVYAMAGHVKYVDNSFNFLSMMQSCISKQKDFDSSMELFQQRAKTEISSILKKFSKKSINTLIETNKGSFLTVVAISFVNGEKKMKEMKFSIEAINKNKWSVLYKETNDSGVGSLRFLGHGANASRFVRDNNLFFGNGKNIPGKINDLIEMESKSTITVGLPADVISIYDGGYKRVISSGLCSEVSDSQGS
jgi:arginyl-tRNA synthetase